MLIVGGEACPRDLAARWHRPGRVIFNSYGPTEATVAATYAVLEPNGPVTIGKALPNYRTFILDDQLDLVPIGAEGELYLGGEGIARGYLHRDDLTRERFVVTERPGGGPVRLYRTGDLARFTETGDIEYLGRADAQVKLRGFRIELTEIESVLMEPSSHVTAQDYAKTLEIALAAGFNAVGTPRIFRSRTTLLERP